MQFSGEFCLGFRTSGLCFWPKGDGSSCCPSLPSCLQFQLPRTWTKAMLSLSYYFIFIFIFYLKERLTTSPPLSVMDAQGGIFSQVLAGILGPQLSRRDVWEPFVVIHGGRCRVQDLCGEIQLSRHIVYHGWNRKYPLEVMFELVSPQMVTLGKLLNHSSLGFGILYLPLLYIL